MQGAPEQMEGQPEEIEGPGEGENLGQRGEQAAPAGNSPSAQTAITEKKPATIPARVALPWTQPFWPTVWNARMLLGPGVKAGD